VLTHGPSAFCREHTGEFVGLGVRPATEPQKYPCPRCLSIDCADPDCVIADSKTGWESGGQKDDAGKPRMDLLDAYAIEELSKVLTFGAKKYAPNQWRKGIKISRLVAALLRHTFAFMAGANKDPETGLDHMAHAMCCCMFLIWTMKHKEECDDR